MSNIIEPQSWAEVYEALFEGTHNSRTDRYKSRFAFRGLSSERHELVTSLMRLGGEYAKVEPHLLRQFKKYAYQHVGEKHNEWYWLSVAQHYGLPTRLLDWSYSPEVALHFATANIGKYDTNGAVWKVNYKEVHKLMPSSYAGVLEDQNTWILTSELLDAMFKTIKQLEHAGHDNGRDFFLFYEPPSLDQRIFNQFAYFSVGTNPHLSMDKWLEDHPDIWFKVIIPKELKWEIRDKLDQSNMSERILFPGLGGVAQWLARYYYPTGSASISK